ncbi:dicarboxylate/amino acid:cation symporter [Arcanobacterium ihumii]|uniref:dicarboxylate/amino acid:cation symporter n=1 Tax=Arcanobacterium ihumii TaxID=2138162 RepID=UPI000F53F1C9|nr:dicarboxylate/amino acid:cation symporter [Arcanobacterium ihumii]
MTAASSPEQSLWKRMSKTLLFWVILAIVVGALLGQFLPNWAIVPFATFNDLFGKFLSFMVPLIIVGLVTPAIFELGKSGGKWLLVTVVLAYSSTMIAGFGTWGLAALIFPSLLRGQAVPDLATPENAVASLMDPSFTLPPVFGVMTALIVAFVFGIGMVTTRAVKMMAIFVEFRDLMMMVILKAIVPLLPLHIFGIFLNMSKSGQFVDVIVAMGKVILFAFILTLVMMLLQYGLAGAVAKRNPLAALWGMRDAYFTALGTASSAATIPVTVRCTRANGVSHEISDFVIPLCATIHLAGSTIKITAFALALQYMMGISPSPTHMAGFIMMLGVIMVAAPGVPGGAITAAQSVLQGILGFTDPMYAIMVAMYVAVDSFGTATNVTGDGAIAIIVDKLAAGSLGNEKESALEAAEEITAGRELRTEN